MSIDNRLYQFATVFNLRPYAAFIFKKVRPYASHLRMKNTTLLAYK